MSDNNNINDMIVATESIQNVGVIGLGRMGTAIANNIIKSGLTLWSTIVQQTRQGTSTISPSLSTTLAQMHSVQGSLYLAAPVLGNPAVAREGKLTTFVAGDETAIKSCNRLLNSYCHRIIEVGDQHAKANSLKLSANYVMLVLLDVIGQVYVLAGKSNIDLQLVNELLEMIFAYPGLKQYAKRIRTRDFDNVGFDLLSAYKDVQLILQTSSDVRVPLSFANNIKDKYIAAIANTWRKKTGLAYMRFLVCLQD